MYFYILRLREVGVCDRLTSLSDVGPAAFVVDKAGIEGSIEAGTQDLFLSKTSENSWL